MKQLTERRKADRIEMARQVRELAEGLGMTVTEDSDFPPRNREIRLDLAHPGGARISIDFHGDSCQPDVHVGSWYIDSQSPACFSDMFGDINTYHYRKATFVARGFDALLAQLRLDIGTLNTGMGYDKERTEKFMRDYPERFLTKA